MEPLIKSKDLLKTTLFLELLASQDEKELTRLMNNDGPKYARLLIAMSATIDKSCGNLNKVFEQITALELKAEEYSASKYDIVHVKHEYGADLQIIDKESSEIKGFEIKNSVVKASLLYKSNWLFKLNDQLLARYKAERRVEDLQALIGSVYEKQKNGVTCFVARTGTQKLNCYKLSGAFVAIYVIKKLISATSSSLNFGSERCPHCKHYHRVQQLIVYSEMLENFIKVSGKPFEYRLDYFNTKEWTLILKPVQTSTGCVKC